MSSSYRHMNARRSQVTFWVKLSVLQILKVQLKWHTLSHIASLNTNHLHFYVGNKMSKSNRIQRRSEHKIAFPAKWQKCTYGLLAFNRRYMTFDHMSIRRFPYYINKPSLVQIWLQLFKWDHFHIFTFSAYLTTWPQITFDVGIWPLTAWTYEGSHILSINQVWFKSDFNFPNKATFTFSAHLTTWLQMNFDLDMWSLTSSTNEGSHVASMTQLWLKSIKACGS